MVMIIGFLFYDFFVWIVLCKYEFNLVNDINLNINEEKYCEVVIFVRC